MADRTFGSNRRAALKMLLLGAPGRYVAAIDQKKQLAMRRP